MSPEDIMQTIKVPRTYVLSRSRSFSATLHSLSECARRDSKRLRILRKQGFGVRAVYVEDAIIRKANRILSVLALRT